MRMMKRVDGSIKQNYYCSGCDVAVQVHGGYAITEEISADVARQMQIRYGFTNATENSLPAKPVAKAPPKKAKRKAKPKAEK